MWVVVIRQDRHDSLDCQGFETRITTRATEEILSSLEESDESLCDRRHGFSRRLPRRRHDRSGSVCEKPCEVDVGRCSSRVVGVDVGLLGLRFAPKVSLDEGATPLQV